VAPRVLDIEHHMTIIATSCEWAPEVQSWVTFVRLSCDICDHTLPEMELDDIAMETADTGWQRVGSMDECPDCIRRQRHQPHT
jgi:hypothetical protein